MFKNIRPLVFFPTFIILVGALVFSLVNLDQFLHYTGVANSFVLNHFSWLFSLGSFYLLVLVGVTYCSKLGNIRIGGEDAKPHVSKLRWFMIVLCTTLAVGVLFWTTAEPLYHLHTPPKSLHIKPDSPDAILFAFSAMFLHWGPTPYAIYAIPALIFGLAFYNLKMPYSISSSLKPVLGKWVSGKKGDVIDALALYSLVVGMASSLGTGALTLVGGVSQFIPIERNALTLGITIAAIVAVFVFSAARGLIKGIARLSMVNFWLLIALFVFVLVLGPTQYILNIGVEGVGAYLENFFRLSLFTGQAAHDNWPHSWSVFYWAVWFAWAPITAMFLGKIARGYTVREFIMVNVIFPSLFVLLWIAVFSGTAIFMDQSSGGELYSILNNGGIEQLLYHIFGELPLGLLTTFILVFVAFVSYVTAADSSTDAIGDLCMKDFNADSNDTRGIGVKVLWGIIIGLVAWIMVSTVGVKGIKSLSNLGGLPATLIILGCSATLIKWIKKPELLDRPEMKADKK
ncbi:MULTISPECIES: BCCT family transporter [Vibrio]|uniref:BCCT family transporter n=2 Tax=Vibrio TaxID=662 RepID=A0A7X4LP59_9VIBR|nr:MULTISPECIES: BCCT family transporter [Vibrio]MBF9003055.1 BCCT family transporter [Vibrio nitrifigilis]MZI95396.1 BCCT family transporter [Vibrio eleionomae]